MNLCPFTRGVAPLPALAIAGLVAGCASEPDTTVPSTPPEVAARASGCFDDIVASHAEFRREIEAGLEFDPEVLDSDPVRLAAHGEALQALADDDARFREWLAGEGRGEVLACLEELGRVTLAQPGPDGPDVPPPARPTLAAGAPPGGERDEEPPDTRFQCNGRPCNCKAVVIGSAVAWDTPTTDRRSGNQPGYTEPYAPYPGQQEPGYCDSFLGERWQTSWAKDLGRVPYRNLGARIYDFLLEGTSGRVAKNARELGFTSYGGLIWLAQWFPRWCEFMTPRFAGRRMLTMKMAWKLVPRVVPGPGGGWVDNRENAGAFPWPTEPAEGQTQKWYGASCPEGIVVKASVEPQLSFGLSATARVDGGPKMGIEAESASNYAARASGRLTCFGSGTIDTNPGSFSIVEAQHTTAFDAIVQPTGCARNLRAESSTTFDATAGMAGGEGGSEYRQGHTNSQSCAERTARLAVNTVRCSYKAEGQALLRLESPALQSAAVRHNARTAVLGSETSPLMLRTTTEPKPFDTLRVGYALDNLYLHVRSTPRLPTDSNTSGVASAVIRPLTTDPDTGVPAAFIRFQGQGCSVHDRKRGTSYTEPGEIPCQWIGSSGDNPPRPPRYDYVGAQLISTFSR